MKNNKGITMLILVITIIILLILAGISLNVGNSILEESKLENLETNMLLIKVKGKEYVENANFKLGTNIDSTEKEQEKNTRIAAVKEELKGDEIEDYSILNQITNQDLVVNENEYIYYYKLTTEHLTQMGLSNVASNDKKGWYIIKYDVKNIDVEIYNTKGFEYEDKIYYSLSDMQNLEI